MPGTSLRTGPRGATLVLVAVSMVALMGMAALAVDLARLQNTRAEAQRASDAAALAGASAFTEGEDNNAQGAEAIVRALDVASRNFVAGSAVAVGDAGACDPPPIPVDGSRLSETPRTPDRTVQTCEVSVAVWYPEGNDVPARVGVRVQEAEVSAWFAKIFGRQSFKVGAGAAAIATGAGAAKCVQPVLFPDYWDETNGDTNGDHWPDVGQGQSGEDWEWMDDPVVTDRYEAFKVPSTGTETGLGSDFRNGLVTNGVQYYRDVGRPFVMKPSGGGAPYAPSFYNLWDIPGGDAGGRDVHNRILDCDPDQLISLATTYDNKPGATIGPVTSAYRELLRRDPSSRWDERDTLVVYKTGSVEGSVGDWKASSRVLLIPLAHPEWVAGGRTEVQFNNFALFWLEAVQGNNIIVRFIGPATGGLGGPTQGPLLKTVRLVE